jgi:hypothetical protein
MEWISTDDRLPEPEQFIIYHAPGIFETGPQMWIGTYEEGVFGSRSGFSAEGKLRIGCHYQPCLLTRCRPQLCYITPPAALHHKEN